MDFYLHVYIGSSFLSNYVQQALMMVGFGLEVYSIIVTMSLTYVEVGSYRYAEFSRERQRNEHQP